jgi:hypothetical protein
MNIIGTGYFGNLAETKSKKKPKKVQFYYHKWINNPQFEHNLLTQAYV